MAEFLKAVLDYPFMTRALLVGIPVSLCAALLGVNLVLKRYSMIGDGLSHVGFGALAVALVLGMAPLAVAIPVVIVAAFLLLRVSARSNIGGDAAIALISTSAIAIGVTAISIKGGMNTDIYNYMFGSVLAMDSTDVTLSLLLSAVVIVCYIVFFNRIFSVTFDENFAEATGQGSGFCNTLLAVLTAVTIVIGMRLMGTMLISSLVIFPALTAMRVCKTFRPVVIVAAVVSVVCFFFGMMISYLYSTPTGASVVLCNLAMFVIFSLAGKLARARKR